MALKNTVLRVATEINDVVALVLGGGRGSRLYPLTAERAKPAVPLDGRYRLVDIPLSNGIHSTIKRVYVFTQFNSASLHRHINNSYKFDIFSGGFVEILAAEQTVESGDWYQGTADAIRKQVRELDHLSASHFLILSGDQLYRMDYRTMLETHIRADADITVGVIPVTREAAAAFGILKVNAEGAITEFVEKPRTPQLLDSLITPPSVFSEAGLEANGRDYLASMGVYLFKPEVLIRILHEEKAWVDFGHDVIPNSLKRLKVQSHLFSGYWEDIGTVRSYYETSILLTGANPPFEFHLPGQPIYSRPRFLPGARIEKAEIVRSLICEGSTIVGANVSDSIIGIRTIVRGNATIDRSVLMGSDYFEGEKGSNSAIPMGIGEGSVISRAIIDKNARIGKNVVIRGSDGMPNSDGDGYAVRDGLVIVLKSAIIPDGTTIE
ncbi:MAG: glucose-1-phosphate adenylyltransferase [Candidatus Hydrogenedentales bacterium]|jgi:glucose-1-phosphate adenylyltransferase